jgi:PAS domain S-box-containing protein
LTVIDESFSETELFTLLDQGSNAIYVTEASSGQFVYVNQKAAEMTGYNREDLLGQHISTLDNNLDPTMDWQDLVDAMREYPSFTIESEHIHRDGSTFPVEVDNDYIELENETYVLAIVRNLSERISKREKIVDYYDYYHELFKYSPVALIELDASEAVEFLLDVSETENVSPETVFDMNSDYYWDIYSRCDFLDVNEATLELFEVSTTEELLANLPEIHTPQMKQKFQESFLKMIDGNMRNQVEIQIKTLTGEERYILFDYMVPPSSQEDFSRVFISMADITPRREIEKELEESLETKSTLLQEIHHRVKNNMQIVASLLNTQARDVESEEAMEAFDKSIQRVRTMAIIHEKLYDVDQLGKLNFESFIEDLCKSLVDFHKNRITNYSLEVRLEPVELDLDSAISCGLILNELVSNSYQHALDEIEEGKLDILFESLNDNKIQLTVSDNGPGFSLEESSDETSSVGLSILKSLVEYELNGTLSINSDDGFQAVVIFEV